MLRTILAVVLFAATSIASDKDLVGTMGLPIYEQGRL